LKYSTRSLKKYIFIILCLIIASIYILAFSPAVSRTIFTYPNGSKYSIQKDSASSSEILILNLSEPFKPEISDYILINLNAANKKNVQYPFASIALNIEEQKLLNESLPKVPGSSNEQAIYVIQERFKIYTDGFNHTYFLPVGENKYWTQHFIFAEETPKNQVDKLVLEIPKIDGIDININKIEIKKRHFFAFDSYINFLLKSNFNIISINRYITPVYIFIIIALIIFLFFQILFNPKKFTNRPVRNAAGSKETLYTGLKVEAAGKKINTKSSPHKILITVIICIPFLFCFYFINNYIFTLKSFWDSYKKNITSFQLSQTYSGFYNFRSFIFWVDMQIPEGQNIIVLLKGEPVYIMSEMAYNLYPRDLKFLDVDSKSDEQLIREIDNINLGKNLNNKNRYNYIVVLSKENTPPHSITAELIAKYRETGGYIYKLE